MTEAVRAVIRKLGAQPTPRSHKALRVQAVLLAHGSPVEVGVASMCAI